MKYIMKSLIIISYLVLLSPVIATAVISFDENTNNETITSFSSDKNLILEIPVWIKNSANISYLDFSIKYDESVIKPEKITKNIDEIECQILQNEIKTEFDFSKIPYEDFLIIKIAFRLTGYEKESSVLKFEINDIFNENEDEIPYILVNGIVTIENNGSQEEDSKRRMDSSLSDLINSNNPTEYAEKNNLEFEDGKVKVVVETNNSKEEKFVSVDELTNLTNNNTITKISPYREIPIKEIIIILLIIILLIILILKLRI
ncbi:MAG: hypothetical protein DRP06_03565 [Candidatus Aenigmatarchaeota archaeon]|nr:MAG: hypothetical protein DRP06_03565 [Candidatus Aenigmarchaeota archaeon]